VNELALFAGAGGGILGGLLLGWRTVCAVELDAYCRSVLLARQRDGLLQRFPIWDDIRTFNGHPWRGHVDVVSGGFPCQDISCAGRGAGLAGERSGLWFEMFRVIGEVRPAYVFAENSPMLRTRGLDVVLKGLAELGYDAAWGVLGAWHVGAPHRRNRMWIVAAHPRPLQATRLRRRCRNGRHTENARRADGNAHGERKRCAQHEPAKRAGDAGDALRQQSGRSRGVDGPEERVTGNEGWWDIHRFARVDDGVADRVERIRATGNGQVPAVAALAWRALSRPLDLSARPTHQSP